MKMFSNNKNSIPETWLGHWKDKNGKQLIIQFGNSDTFKVSVLDKSGQPFNIDLLDNKTETTINLIARQSKDRDGNPIIQVEAGNDGLGPTLNLYFLTKDKNGQKNLAVKGDDISDIFISPNIGLGLYDDWEDDLGVPWAFPLDDYFKSTT